MKTFASKEKRSAPAVGKVRSYVHHPMGPAQQVQRAEIRRILRSTDAQAKLTISQPNDKYEQEADRVADQVMAMPDPKLQCQPEGEEEEETLQTKLLADRITPLVQRQEEPPEEEEEELQAKSKPGETSTVTPSLESRLHSLRGSDQPLSKSDCAFFESRFGRDFSGVRVHTGPQAAKTAQVIHSRAFTIGRNVVFGSGLYAPGTTEGRKLLAHELTHVVQQSRHAGMTGLQSKPQESTQFTFAPEIDIELILGLKPERQSVAVDRAKLLELYKYLKHVRRVSPATEQLTKNVLDIYFPGYGIEVWDASKKPFAGYVGTAYRAGRRIKAAKLLGLTETGRGRWAKRFLGSDVLFFAGHHYGEGEFDALDLSKVRSRGRRPVFHRVKLIMISSCNVLRKSELPTFKRRFPNAYILGWYRGAPYRQSYMMTRFLAKLPNDLLLQNASDIPDILRLWETFVENLGKEGVRLRSEEGKKRSRWGLGYATPDGKVKYSARGKSGKWIWKTEQR